MKHQPLSPPLRLAPTIGRFIAELGPAVRARRDSSPVEPPVRSDRSHAPPGSGWMLPPLCAGDRAVRLWIGPRAGSALEQPAKPSRAQQSWILGSETDAAADLDDAPLGAGVTIAYDARGRAAVVQTSIAGLPPVFAYEARGRVVLASDLWSLRCWLGEPFQFDPDGVADFVRVGHPLGFRTLYQHIRLVPGARRLTLRPDSGLSIETSWSLPERHPLPDWPGYVSHQTELFLEALQRIDPGAGFLSLSGGIDSRAILAGLLHQGRSLPVRTMSWKSATLDAAIAGELCEYYRIPHEIVRFDGGFRSRLPDHAYEASRLSGGLASIAQATEVAFYTDSPAAHERISGYLGNQVGRGGHEATRLRGCNAGLLAKDLRARLNATEQTDGPRDPMNRSAHRLHSIQLSSTFASLGNYSIGHHFAVQHSPYASRSLIEALSLSPDAKRVAGKETAVRHRVRDLRHRVMGERRDRSFQWSFVRGVGGFVADCRVNWGRTPNGGWSLRGLGAGMLAFGDALIAPDTLPPRSVRRRLVAAHLAGRFDFRRLQEWCPPEYMYDMLTDSYVRDQGVLSQAFIADAIARYSAGDRRVFGDLHAALDLAYASRVFTRRLSDHQR